MIFVEFEICVNYVFSQMFIGCKGKLAGRYTLGKSFENLFCENVIWYYSLISCYLTIEKI